MNELTVCMSAYNGEKYIAEQIESIMTQEGCSPFLYIRDDGSTDNTLDVAKRAAQKYEGRIAIESGTNIGYRKSFLTALCNAPETEYFAFADQDDVWLPNKCSSALKKLKGIKIKYKLYTSSLFICDEKLNKAGINDIITSPNNIVSYFIRHRLAGCTMVFDRDLRNAVCNLYSANMIKNPLIDHDFLVGSVAYSYGVVLRDAESHILHRRIEKSVTSGGKGIVDRIKTEKFVVFERKDINFDLANAILSYQVYKNMLNKDVEDFLNAISVYKKSAFNKMKLLKYPGLTSGILACDMEARTKIIMGTF